MKINKLLFFLLAVFSLNSCVEYVDNGTKPNGPELPEELKFLAVHSNPNEAKYIGDKFEFTAALNGVDVTKSTKFKVNGTTIPGSAYTPVKTGPHTVIATMDDYTATFKFTVLEDEEEPLPTGNRIEYGGDSYPVSETVWIVDTDANGDIMGYTENGVTFTIWAMLSTEYDSSDKVVNQFLTYTNVPILNPTTPAFPNEATSALIDAGIGGRVVINGTEVFKIAASNYTILSTGNTVPTGWLGLPSPWTGTANYTATATGTSSGNSAKLFWNGAYMAGMNDIASKPAKKAKLTNLTNLSAKDLKNLKSVNVNDMKKLKFAK